MAKTQTSNDQRQYDRLLTSPRIKATWRGVCDGLPEFRETCELRQNGFAFFYGSREQAERLLSGVLLSGGRCANFFNAGEGI
jgi:hypothetical protein